MAKSQSVWNVKARQGLTIGTASESGIDARAKRRLSLAAVPTLAVGYIEGEDDPVALLEDRAALAYLFDDAHILVAWTG